MTIYEGLMLVIGRKQGGCINRRERVLKASACIPVRSRTSLRKQAYGSSIGSYERDQTYKDDA